MNVKLHRTHARLFLILGFVILLPSSTPSRSDPATIGSLAAYNQDWKEFSSSAGGFSIFFPKLPTKSTASLNVGKMIVQSHTFIVRDDHTYTVMYFDVPHTDDPKAKGDLLLGFRNFVLAEFKAELLSDNPISIGPHAGRLLEVSVPKRGIGRAIIVVTESRLYRIAVVPEKRGLDQTTKAVSTRFFESFRLSAIDRSGEGEVDVYLRTNPELAQRAIATDDSNSILNGKALSLAPPEYPSLALGVHASGTVVVKLIIDEEGRVIAAQAIGGPPLLQAAAVAAARKARFSPTLEKGKPVKILGKVTYNFRR